MPKQHQKFRKEYTAEFKCLEAFKQGDGYAYCTLCMVDFSVAQSGKYDCRSHCNGKKHKQHEADRDDKRAQTLFNVGVVIRKGLQDEFLPVMKAECLMTAFEWNTTPTDIS